MPGTVYILKSLKNGRFYIGSTSELSRRLREHKEGRSKYTRNSLPVRLVFSQKYQTLEQARRIEYQLKKLKRRDIIERIISEREIKLGT